MLSLASLSAQATYARLDLSVGDDGHFSIAHDGHAWLEGTEYQVAGLSRAAGTLQQVGKPTAGSGTDALGDYKSTTLEWAATGSNDVDEWTGCTGLATATSWRGGRGPGTAR